MTTCEELSFDPVKHLYKLNGVPIPSVTQIMRPISLHKYQGIDAETLQHAADRGTNVHEAIEFYAKYGIDDIHGADRPYFEAFLKWVKDYKPVIQESESMVYHRQLMYAGTLDMRAVIAGKRTLIDFKTTATLNDMLTTVQLEAYQRALASTGEEIDQKAILLLRPDASYLFKVYPANDLEAWKTFTALLTVRAHVMKYGG